MADLLDTDFLAAPIGTPPEPWVSLGPSFALVDDVRGLILPIGGEIGYIAADLLGNPTNIDIVANLASGPGDPVVRVFAHPESAFQGLDAGMDLQVRPSGLTYSIRMNGTAEVLWTRALAIPEDVPLTVSAVIGPGGVVEITGPDAVVSTFTDDRIPYLIGPHLAIGLETDRAEVHDLIATGDVGPVDLPTIATLADATSRLGRPATPSEAAALSARLVDAEAALIVRLPDLTVRAQPAGWFRDAVIGVECDIALRACGLSSRITVVQPGSGTVEEMVDGRPGFVSVRGEEWRRLGVFPMDVWNPHPDASTLWDSWGERNTWYPWGDGV